MVVVVMMELEVVEVVVVVMEVEGVEVVGMTEMMVVAVMLTVLLMVQHRR